ncbi:hypothetical protein SO802_031440 [Lithocarpus litseifolius]|uniref:Reverse transcriptase zinc-binding domain-containing protein n=1 Tax=Lithocarpus litseifolius TaxID=425828 RepID=A0AAW2BNL2_9ROSI
MTASSGLAISGGVLTIKSAYHIALSFVDSNEEGKCSSPDPRTSLWKRIWRLKIPQKLKIFAWRSCVNGLPTMLNLSQRGIHCSGFCPICDKALESTAHALLLCDHAKLTWAQWLNCPVEITSSPRDLVDVALDFIENGSPLDLELFFAMAWSIWWNRNQATHENLGPNPGLVWERANRLLLGAKTMTYEVVVEIFFLHLSSSKVRLRWQNIKASPPTKYFDFARHMEVPKRVPNSVVSPRD